MAISLSPTDRFKDRHTGSSPAQVADMLETLGIETLDRLIEQTIPASIRMEGDLRLPEPLTESELLEQLATLASKNMRFRSYIGMGYSGTITPPAIQRGILENPSWYTQYTPYQAEISQGRLEALLNFQTVILDLTGMDIANASLLDEGTAAAEAMMMIRRMDRKGGRTRFLISDACHPQTIAVVAARARPIGIDVEVGPVDGFSFDTTVIGALVQYPDTHGEICDYAPLCASAHEQGSFIVVAADLLSLTLLTEPATFGADVVVGSTQRFGVPMGFGGPHAAFFAVKERFKRQTPGRIIGISTDADGKPALRMALQTREQHIRRDRATSNICTSQVLLAVMASMYAVYHGPGGLRAIARRIHDATRVLAAGLRRYGYSLRSDRFFDTLVVDVSSQTQSILRERALTSEINLRYFENGSIGISLDETVTVDDLRDLLSIFNIDSARSDDPRVDISELIDSPEKEAELALPRTTAFMEHEVFRLYHSETELTRYMYRLSSRDLSLTASMIPLGSCTMKLNAVAELAPISWAGFNSIHPFVPENQVKGYRELTTQLESWLAEITGFSRTSLQPNSGASGEYTGLLTIRAFQANSGQGKRDICLIPSSAHGTNPASAIMAGLKVIVVACDDAGNIDVEDLRRLAGEHADNLAAFMVTYPSTHGVFEESIKEICSIVHEHGGQVYMDGANMNAQVGYCRPGDIGADVCHLNLHKTFAIPHGGGGRESGRSASPAIWLRIFRHIPSCRLIRRRRLSVRSLRLRSEARVFCQFHGPTSPCSQRKDSRDRRKWRFSTPTIWPTDSLRISTSSIPDRTAASHTNSFWI